MRSFIMTAALTVVAGCAAGGGNSEAPRLRRDIITRAQIEEMNATDAYDVVQRIRPEYLRQRGASSIQGGQQLAVVYVDGVRRGTPDILKTLRTNEVEEIRFIGGTDATTRYGTDHGGGAIEIKSRRG